MDDDNRFHNNPLRIRTALCVEGNLYSHSIYPFIRTSACFILIRFSVSLIGSKYSNHTFFFACVFSAKVKCGGCVLYQYLYNNWNPCWMNVWLQVRWDEWGCRLGEEWCIYDVMLCDKATDTAGRISVINRIGRVYAEWFFRDKNVHGIYVKRNAYIRKPIPIACERNGRGNGVFRSRKAN